MALEVKRVINAKEEEINKLKQAHNKELILLRKEFEERQAI
jgi:hypothetical protein